MSCFPVPYHRQVLVLHVVPTVLEQMLRGVWARKVCTSLQHLRPVPLLPLPAPAFPSSPPLPASVASVWQFLGQAALQVADGPCCHSDRPRFTPEDLCAVLCGAYFALVILSVLCRAGRTLRQSFRDVPEVVLSCFFSEAHLDPDGNSFPFEPFEPSSEGLEQSRTGLWHGRYEATIGLGCWLPLGPGLSVDLTLG